MWPDLLTLRTAADVARVVTRLHSETTPGISPEELGRRVSDTIHVWAWGRGGRQTVRLDADVIDALLAAPPPRVVPPVADWWVVEFAPPPALMWTAGSGGPFAGAIVFPNPWTKGTPFPGAYLAGGFMARGLAFANEVDPVYHPDELADCDAFHRLMWSLLGALADRKADQKFKTSFPALTLGSAIIFAFGLIWLKTSLDLSWAATISAGLTPFIFGELLKIAITATSLPLIWRKISQKLNR